MEKKRDKTRIGRQNKQCVAHRQVKASTPSVTLRQSVNLSGSQTVVSGGRRTPLDVTRFASRENWRAFPSHLLIRVLIFRLFYVYERWVSLILFF